MGVTIGTAIGEKAWARQRAWIRSPNVHLDGGPLVVLRQIVLLALLAAPSMRRWIARNR